MRAARLLISSGFLIILAGGVLQTAADQKKSSPAASRETVAKPLNEKEKKRKEEKLRKELETPYRKWLNEDVAYIITDEERAAFERMQTSEEREQFIEQFWLRRDPTPDTIENEFKEEHSAASLTPTSILLREFRDGRPGASTSRSDRPMSATSIRPGEPMSGLPRKVAGRPPRIHSRTGGIVSLKASVTTLSSNLSTRP